MDLEETRLLNREKIACRLDGLSQGRDITSLCSFAKAYLGMYLDLDVTLLPDERVGLLIDNKLMENIWSGFDAVLLSLPLPSPEDTGRALSKDVRLDKGYIAIAALDRRIRLHGNVPDLDKAQIESLICFNYANRNDLENNWIKQFAIDYPDLYSDALIRMWMTMRKQGSAKLPGLGQIIMGDGYQSVLDRLVLPVLTRCKGLDRKMLSMLLKHALFNNISEELLSVCKIHLEHKNKLPVVEHVYWLTTAYMISPGSYHHSLFGFVGRTREKALPLLNYFVQILRQDKGGRLFISPDMIADILYMVAPKFRPVHDRFGSLDDNAQKITWLFKHLNKNKSDRARQALDRLRRVRVMRVYSEYMDEV